MSHAKRWEIFRDSSFFDNFSFCFCLFVAFTFQIKDNTQVHVAVMIRLVLYGDAFCVKIFVSVTSFFLNQVMLTFELI